MARVLGVDRRAFQRRARRYGFPRMAGGFYDPAVIREWWWKTNNGNGHGGSRPGAGAKPRGEPLGVSRTHPADVAVDALIDELCAGFDGAPWPGVHREAAAGREYSFTVAQARGALEAVPLARAWLFHAWLMGGDFMNPCEQVFDEARSRRFLVGSALRWAVALHRADARGDS